MRIGARRLFDGWSTRGPSIVDVEDASIVAVSDADGSFAGCETVVDLLSPGFVDMQVNGWDGLDLAELEPETLARLSLLLAGRGTTSFLATLITAPKDLLDERLVTLDAAIASLARHGAGAVGIHLEGPFLGSRPGAHPPHDVADIDEQTAGWFDSLPETVRLLTLGCEADAAPAAIAALVRRGIVVALGHTAPDETSFLRAVTAGAGLVTHLYNAMSGVHHRDDGLASMALTTDSVSVSLIADGIHVGRRAATIAFRSKPAGTIAIVSDSVAWSAPRLVRAGATLDGNGAVRLPDGTLAGAATCIADGVKRLAIDWGLDLEEVLRAATSTPARILGLTDRGRLGPGLRADLVGLDDLLRVRTAWVGGRLVPA